MINARIYYTGRAVYKHLEEIIIILHLYRGVALFTSLLLRDGVLKGECYERPTGVIRVNNQSCTTSVG